MNYEEYMRSKGVFLVDYDFSKTAEENVKMVRGIENVLGKECYICDYRVSYLNPLGKMSRNIKPKKVVILSIAESNKIFRCDHVFFKEIKNGKILSTEIPVYNRRGSILYMNNSDSVKIFNTKKECVCFLRSNYLNQNIYWKIIVGEMK